MKKFFLSLLLCALGVNFAFGVERPRLEDYVACWEKNKASVFTYEGMQAFVLSENLLAVVKPANKKLNTYVKYDPFLNLYLVRTEFSLIPSAKADEQNLTRNDWVGIIDPSTPNIGHLKYLAQSLDERDQLDFKSKVGQLNDCCCAMIGISLNDSSFIGNRYLNHFAKYNDVYWGDIGVDFIFRDGKIYVDRVRKGAQFLINDELVSVDGEPAKDLRVVNEKILFADRGSTLYFNVLRDNEDLNISAEVFPKDLSKFNLPGVVKKPASQAFRSNLGMSINNNLIITRVEAGSKAAAAGFIVGDKILRINNEIITSAGQARSVFTAGNDFNVLISRSGTKLPPINASSELTRAKTSGEFNFFIRLTK